MKPIVTVGVCARNCEETIERAVQSILHQDYPYKDMEIILVDDGSEDKTPLILRRYVRDENPHTALFEVNWMGLGKARNLVADNAKGDYIIWVDGDMVLPKNHVRMQVEFMEENPKVGIGKAQYGLSPDEGMISFLENIVDVARDSVSNVEWKSDLRLPGTGGAIYRVEALREVGGFDNDLRRVGEDQDVSYRIRRAGWSIQRTDAVFYERRQARAWADLLSKNFGYGYDHYRLYRKNRDLFVPFRMVPPASFVAGLLISHVAYKLTHRKSVFLLPFQYAFKMTAWFCGFLKCQMSFKG